MFRTRLALVGVLLGGLWLGLNGLSLCQGAKKEEKKGDEKTAALKIIVPEDNAKVTVNSRPTKKRGTERSYTLELLSDDPTDFEVTASWEPNNYTLITRTKKISVKPGDSETI